MKKIILSALCFIIVLLTGCQSYIVKENDTTPINSSLTETTTNSPSSPNKTTTPNLSTTKETSSFSTTKTEFSERYDESPATDTLQLDINSLKKLKKTVSSMNDTDFQTYLEENRFDFTWLETVNTIEKFNSLLHDIENIYVATLSSNINDNIYLTYYLKENTLFQSVSLSETKRFAFDFYIEIEPLYYFSNIDGAEYIKSVNINSVKANVFELKSRNCLGADAILENQKFKIHVNEIQSIEDFEADFARLEFVKIGDLLNDPNTNITE